jgi:hypothetical protein
MMVQFSETLHQITIAAISELSEEGHERTAELSKPGG